jgi:hypothetical protein
VRWNESETSKIDGAERMGGKIKRPLGRQRALLCRWAEGPCSGALWPHFFGESEINLIKLKMSVSAFESEVSVVGAPPCSAPTTPLERPMAALSPRHRHIPARIRSVRGSSCKSLLQRSEAGAMVGPSGAMKAGVCGVESRRFRSDVHRGGLH